MDRDPGGNRNLNSGDRSRPGRDDRRGSSIAGRLVSGGTRSAQRIAEATGLDQTVEEVVEDAIVRAVESEATERALARILNGPIVRQAVEEALRSESVEQALIETVDSEMVDRVWARVLQSDETQLLIERIAESPEVRDAIAVQSIGLITDIGIQVRTVTAKIDTWVQRLIRKILRRPEAEIRTDRAGLVTRLLSIGLDGLIINFALGLTISLIGVLGRTLGLNPTGGTDFAITVTFLVWFLASSAYLLVFWSLAGQTLAMRFLSIRVEKSNGESHLGLKRAFLRLVGFWVSVAIFFIGFVGALLRADRRALEDVFSDTNTYFIEPLVTDSTHVSPSESDTKRLLGN